jgi:hypothetical protein
MTLSADLLRHHSSRYHRFCSQAFETKNSLTSQRSSLTGSAGGLSNLTANVPGFGRLIDGIQRKKSRETMIIALVVGALCCFVIW